MPLVIHTTKITRPKQGGEFIVYKVREMAARKKMDCFSIACPKLALEHDLPQRAAAPDLQIHRDPGRKDPGQLEPQHGFSQPRAETVRAETDEKSTVY